MAFVGRQSRLSTFVSLQIVLLAVQTSGRQVVAPATALVIAFDEASVGPCRIRHRWP